jgi:hypothetical protein
MKRLLSTTAIAVILASGTALAQDNNLAPGGIAAPPAEAPQVIWAQASGSWLSEDLIGADVLDAEGDSLGSIDNLVISVAAHGDRRPMPAPAPSAATDEYEDEDQALSEAEPADEPLEDEAPAPGAIAGAPTDGQPVEETFAGGQTADEVEPTEEAARDDALPNAADTNEQQTAAAPAPADGTDGSTVMTPTVAMAGEFAVTDIVIGVGGFLGIGEKLVAVPVDRFEFFAGDRGERKVVLNTTREELEDMPEFVETGQ